MDDLACLLVLWWALPPRVQHLHMPWERTNSPRVDGGETGRWTGADEDAHVRGACGAGCCEAGVGEVGNVLEWKLKWNQTRAIGKERKT